MGGLFEQVRIAIHQVWQRRWLALAVAWAVAALGWFAVSMIPNKFESKAKIFVQIQSVLPSDAGAADQASLLRLRQTLTSTENLTRVVRRTDLNSLVQSDADLAGVAAGLRGQIKITALPDNLYEISAESSSSRLSNAQNARAAAGIVQQLVELFAGGEGNAEQTSQSLDFLDQELARREGQLREAEQRKVDFEQRNMGVLPGAGSVGDRLNASRQELAQLDQTIVSARSAISAMQSQLQSMSPTTPMPGGGGFGGPAASQIASLQTQLSQYLGRGFTEQHPDIISIRAQIARLQPQAAQERSNPSAESSLPNPSYTSLRAMISEREAQLAGAQARKAQLDADMASLGQRQETQPEVSAEQGRLQRDYDVLRQQYDRLLADREQLRLRGDIQRQANGLTVRVTDPPRIPSGPSSPNRPLFLTLVLIVAIGAGVAAAFFKGQLQTTFPTSGRLAGATGLPVLGAVSRVVGKAERAEGRRKLLYLVGGGAALAASYVVLMLLNFMAMSEVA